MIFEKWGGYGNSRAPHPAVAPAGAPRPARRARDVWQMLEFSKRFTIGESGASSACRACKAEGFEDGRLPDVLAEAERAGLHARRPRSTKCCSRRRRTGKVEWPDPIAKGKPERHRRRTLGDDLVPREGAVRGVRRVRPRPRATTWRPSTSTSATTCAACAGRWSNGKETPLALQRGVRPVRDGAAPASTSTARHEGAARRATCDGPRHRRSRALPGKAKIFFRPYAAPPEVPDATYDLWLCTGRVLEHWHSGTMTRRVPELHRAVPAALLFMHPKDAEARGLERGTTWRGSSRAAARSRLRRGNGGPLRACRAASVYVPWFDEGVFINKVTLDATCPISKADRLQEVRGQGEPGAGATVAGGMIMRAHSDMCRAHARGGARPTPAPDRRQDGRRRAFELPGTTPRAAAAAAARRARAHRRSFRTPSGD